MTSLDGIILAGGRGTRLGPLAAQISKALVSVGNRPQVVNHILRLQEAGCENIIVITSPDTDVQVGNVIRRAGFTANVCTIVQKEARGPVDALLHGLNYTNADDAIVLFSDTSFDEPLPEWLEWVGISYDYDPDRSWCFLLGDITDGGTFVDGKPFVEHPVTIGAYRVFVRQARKAAHAALQGRSEGEEVGMAPFLNSYGFDHTVEMKTWTDVGDIFSLAASRHKRYTTRASHKLSLNGDGLLVKTGCTDEVLQFTSDLFSRSRSVHSLFPQVYEVDWAAKSITMEHLDLPTLAELWLYWPGLETTWMGIIELLLSRMAPMWQPLIRDHAGKWMAQKAIARQTQWNRDSPIPLDQIMGASDIIGEDTWVYGHGDLNFTNVLFSLNTGAFKLVDPRGTSVPLIYEYAKLGYSPDFAAITHGLIDPVSLKPIPRRTAESTAIRLVLQGAYSLPKLNAAMGLIALAAPPLHKGNEPQALHNLGMEYLRRAGL